MTKEFDFDTMSDRCIAAGEAVMKVGSPELQAAMRLLLAVLGREIAEGLRKPVIVRTDSVRIGRHLN